MTHVLVTALVLWKDANADTEWEKNREGFYMISRLGLPTVLFLDERVAPFETSENVRVVRTMLEKLETTAVVGLGDFPGQPHQEGAMAALMTISNAKTEFVVRATEMIPGCARASWIDMGLCRSLKYPEETLSRLKDAGACEPGITIPGFSSALANKLGISQRFSGDFFTGDPASLLRFREANLRALREISPGLEWETNLWAKCETEYHFSFCWYKASHDDSALNFPRKEIPGCGYFTLSRPAGAAANLSHFDDRLHFKGRKVFLLPENLHVYYAENGLYEAGLIEWAGQLCSKGEVFLDIGAHTGTYAVCLAGLCKEVHAFEPQRDTYYALCGSVALSGMRNVTCVNAGLGSPEQVGRRKLYIGSPDGGTASLHSPSGATRAEDVEIRTLDSYNLSGVGFIKIDAEGNELQILQGAVETLERNRHPKVLFECNGANPALFAFIKDTLKYHRTIKIAGTSNMFLCED